MEKPKVISIVGPTAAGKTSLSIKLAQIFDGEVISADSRQVYRGLDLGSGKVTPAETHGVPHHLLDVADPHDTYTAADFRRDGTIALTDILKRNNLPIIAGGTFFYVDSLLGKLSHPEVPPNETLRAHLATKTNEELFAELQQKDPNRAHTIDPHNQRRLIRALEIIDSLGTVPPLETDIPYDVLTLGISITQAQLHENIHVRLRERLDEGMLTEVENLLKAGVTHERLEDLGLEYRYLSRYLKKELDYDTMVEQLETKIRQFAKRQLTWLKRDAEIIWIDPNNSDGVIALVQDFITTN